MGVTAWRWHGKHISAAMNQHAIEELLEAVFSMWSAPRLYNEDKQQQLISVMSCK
jgi:hypothetical protein